MDNRKLTFKVEAFDEKGKIGEGIHERFIINIEKFMGRVNGKRKR
jgi:predicted thioesterase